MRYPIQVAMRRLFMATLAMTIAMLKADAVIAAEPESANNDLQNLQGTWQLVRGKRDGKQFTEEQIKKTKLIVKGDTFTIPESEVATSQDGTIKIDSSKTPKQMDAITGSGPEKGKTWQGIYQIRGDHYRVCFAPPDKDRPTDFSAKAGTGQLLQLWKREKK